MAKKVYKYGTGQTIPEGAVYLCTKTETVKTYDYHLNGEGVASETKNNILVWHYFLVEVQS